MGGKPRVIIKRFSATVIEDDKTSGCAIELPFEPKQVWGGARTPVVVTTCGHSFRTTTFTRASRFWVPLSRVNREAASVAAGQHVLVAVVEDAKPRTVRLPADLRMALKAAGLIEAWDRLSYSHRREHVDAIEKAARPQTRDRRLGKALDMLRK